MFSKKDQFSLLMSRRECRRGVADAKKKASLILSYRKRQKGTLIKDRAWDGREVVLLGKQIRGPAGLSEQRGFFLIANALHP